MIELVVCLFALSIGSFLNVLIYRLPLGISLINPKFSSCPNCNTSIKWYENIPLFSYIFLKAKCSSCKNKISLIYPIVELITLVFTLLIFYKFSITLNSIVILLVFYVLIVLSFIDLKYKAVPDYLLLLALVLSLFIESINYVSMLTFAGAFVLLDFVLTFYIQNIKAKLTKDTSLLNQRALGEGDIPIVAIIGGLLSIKLAIIAVLIASITALLPSIYNIVKKNEIETPFIPFLVFGLFIVFIFDTSIVYFIGGQ